MSTIDRPQMKDTLKVTTEVKFPLMGLRMPLTIVLESTAGARAINLYGDSALTKRIENVEYDSSGTAMLVLTLTAPCAGFGLVGAINDQWSVL